MSPRGLEYLVNISRLPNVLKHYAFFSTLKGNHYVVHFVMVWVVILVFFSKTLEGDAEIIMVVASL